MTVSTKVRTEPRVWIGVSRPARPEAVIGASLAALVAGLGMLLLRATLEVRSLPERVMEALLVLVPAGLFEAALQRFGFDAKRYGLAAAVLVMLLVLYSVAYAALRTPRPVAVLPAVGLAFWLLVMLVIMPATSAGFFATELENGTGAAIAGYLAVGLSYAAVLAIVQAWRTCAADAPESEPWSTSALSDLPGALQDVLRVDTLDRRAALGLTAAAGLAYVVTYAATLLVGKRSTTPRVLILDPQEPLPSGGLEPPNPHPRAIASPESAPTASPVSASTANAASTASSSGAPSENSLPEPTSTRQVERDKDGAVLRAGRQAGQLAGPITSNADFYVVTKNAAGDPTLHPQDWNLRVDGEVQRPFHLDYATLRKLPAVEVTKTLECISNFVCKPELAPFGAELISTARFKGARVSDVLQLTGGASRDAAWLAVLSADEYTSALPMETALDPGTLLVYEMNGEVLPREHGYPARLLVPDRYGMKNPKWVIALRPMRRELTDWYGQRNWSKTGIVQTMSRIDSPAPGATLAPGANTIAGIAYAGSRGINLVEFSVDGGTSWREARILEPAAGEGEDRWARWEGQFTLKAGASVTLVARATDGTGELQVESFSLPEPDGGTGWPSVDARAR